jgi:hypothetical protein
LTKTSELSKSLYNNNIALEEKHRALLARLPSALFMTPRSTPSSSPAPTPEHKPTPLPHFRPSHARRISVSPSDLSLLADQNVELLQKLEKLEAESTQANLAGRRRLGKLEKEIDVLRGELDQHRTQSDALQLQVERGEEEKARRRRQEWNDRVRAHRSNKSGSSWAFSSDMEGSVRDFAPSSSGGSSSRPALSSTACKPTLPTAPDTASLSPCPSLDIPVEAPDPRPLSPQESLAVPTFPSPVGESALVAQLVSKVRELEFTNEQILESQRNTSTKLQEAQIEAEGIRRLYAFLDERNDVELEVVEDSEHEGQHVHDPSSTMRFRSLRRSINGDLRQLTTSTLGNDTEADKGGTMHRNTLIKGHPLKARKTVVGLFDTPSQPARDGAEPAMMMSNPPSPSLSSLELPAGSLFSASRQASHVPTLGSELGSDYGGDYAENHHLRSSSLYDVFLSGPSPSSRPATPTSPPRNTQTSSGPLLDEPQVSNPPQDLDKTPQKTSFKPTHQHRLSEISDTIRARTNYWVDRRFHNTAPIRRLTGFHGSEARDNSLKGPVSASKPAVSQAAVQTTSCDAEEHDFVIVRADDVPLLQSTSTSQVAKKKSRAMKVVLEIWLWVQFVVIIMVFLCAVTKRGPRSVLRNGSRTLKRVE